MVCDEIATMWYMAVGTVVNFLTNQKEKNKNENKVGVEKPQGLSPQKKMFRKNLTRNKKHP